MSSIVQIETRPPSRSMWIWFAPVQAAAAFTVLAVAAGGQVLRTWLLTALVWLMAMPLLVSLEAGLIAMMVFEPLRGVLRRAARGPLHVRSDHTRRSAGCTHARR